VDVPADQLDLVADPVEDQDPLVAEVQRVAGHHQAPGDRDRREDGLFQLKWFDLGEEVVVLLKERVEALMPGGPGDHFVVIAIFLRVVRVQRAAARTLGVHRFEVEVSRRRRGGRGRLRARLVVGKAR
jgi:hypothetical protein